MYYMQMIRQIMMGFERECNRVLSEYDLTFSQLELQHFLFEQQEKGIPVNQRSIEATLHLKNPTVTGTLNRLESKGFIVRVEDEHDRRSNIILLTDKAHRLRDDVMNSTREREEQLTKGLTLEDHKNLRRILGKMFENVVND